MVEKSDAKCYVIDSSAILSILLPDEKKLSKSKRIKKLLNEENARFISAPLLTYEVGNAIKSALLQKRISAVSARKIIKTFEMLPIECMKMDMSKILENCTKYDLTFYDATYLSLSQSKKCELISLDKHLKPFALDFGKISMNYPQLTLGVS
jgi:predicted nucleic acid-binding protein